MERLALIIEAVGAITEFLGGKVYSSNVCNIIENLAGE